MLAWLQNNVMTVLAATGVIGWAIGKYLPGALTATEGDLVAKVNAQPPAQRTVVVALIHEAETLISGDDKGAAKMALCVSALTHLGFSAANAQTVVQETYNAIQATDEVLNPQDYTPPPPVPVPAPAVPPAA